MKLLLLCIFSCVLIGCNTYGLRSEPEPAPKKAVSDYALQCKRITENYKIPVSCDITKIEGVTVLRVYYPSVAEYHEWSNAVASEVAAPFCVSVADDLGRTAAVQSIVQGDTKNILAHDLFDCETLKSTGWEAIDTEQKTQQVDQYEF